MPTPKPDAVAFPLPMAADVVLCRFPENLVRPAPGPKPRPAVLLQVFPPAPKRPRVYRVKVCYATSNRAKLYPSEIEITADEHPVEYRSAGLSSNTKFDLAKIILLDYTDAWFAVPFAPMYGPVPKLGTLHALTMPRLSAAYKYAAKQN